MIATTTQRRAASNDPWTARRIVTNVDCDYCTAPNQPAEVFMIDGITAEFVCAKHYLERAKERQAEAAKARRVLAGAR